jgi:hypothetical protein
MGIRRVSTQRDFTRVRDQALHTKKCSVRTT